MYDRERVLQAKHLVPAGANVTILTDKTQWLRFLVLNIDTPLRVSYPNRPADITIPISPVTPSQKQV